MFISASATASGDSSIETVTAAINEAVNKLENVKPIIGALVFASSHYEQNEIIQTASRILGPSVPVAGASTAGEISQFGPSQAPSVSVMVFASDTIRCVTAVATGASGNESVSGTHLAQTLLEQDQEQTLQFVTIFCDGLTVNPNGVLRGIETVLPHTPIAGGSAGDDGKYTRTFQYCDGSTYSDSVVAMGFYGPLKLSFGVRHGWSPISGPRTVTKATGSTVQEIDHKPAISLYEEFIGDAAKELQETTLAKIALSYPIGLVVPDSNEMLLRAPFSVNEHGAITFGGEVPEGSQVQLMIGSKEQAVAAAFEASSNAMHELGCIPQAALVYSCHVRDSLFASREESKLEIDAIQKAVGSEVPLAGFYTYAEQAPIHSKNMNLRTCNSVNHNETIVTVLLAEAHE